MLEKNFFETKSIEQPKELNITEFNSTFVQVKLLTETYRFHCKDDVASNQYVFFCTSLSGILNYSIKNIANTIYKTYRKHKQFRKWLLLVQAKIEYCENPRPEFVMLIPLTGFDDKLIKNLDDTIEQMIKKANQYDLYHSFDTFETSDNIKTIEFSVRLVQYKSNLQMKSDNK